MSADLAPADRTLLDRVQAGVPLVERPFAALGAELGVDEADVLGRLARLTETHVLRQIGAIFDTRACGYASALVAARVAPERLDRAAASVGAHPGVSHCYERDHAWNLWFTLAVPPTSRVGLDSTVELLGAAAGADAIRMLPALRTFKIAARFAMDEDGGQGERGGLLRSVPHSLGGAPAPRPSARPVETAQLTSEEIAAIRVLQRPLPLLAEPFGGLAGEAHMSVAELLIHAKGLLDRGVMRRFVALLDHRRAGFGANVMATWALAADRLEAAGRSVAEFPAVTHCYQRPVFADWPYTLFSMVHGKSREECLVVVEAIRAVIRPDAAATLWTVREFKKTRLQLFTPAYDRWEAPVAEAAR